MPFTKQFTVNDTGDPEPLTIGSPGHNVRRVYVGELRSVASWPTTGFNYYGPGSTDPEHVFIGGSKLIERKQGEQPYAPGEQIGTVETASPGGSTTFYQYEEP